MIYVTVRQRIAEHQLTWEDLMFDPDPEIKDFSQSGSAGTVTRTMSCATREILQKINVPKMIKRLEAFNEKYQDLIDADKTKLYRHFTIPKRTGGLRPIDAPCDKLQKALKELAGILSDEFGLLYHTSAFAYVKGRSITQALYKHKANESNWFLKTDFSGFFPSTTLDFAMSMCAMVFPLSEICLDTKGKEALRKALSLGFLNGGLVQGSALSPMLTNIIMIPIDHWLFNSLAHRRFVYTRYADDIHISCIQKFDPNKIVKEINDTLKQFGAPYEIKQEKTHFGSRKGHNFMLGLVLNAENNISIGHQKKKYWKAMTTNLIMDYKHGKPWPIDDVQHYVGLTSYYKMVEPDYFNGLEKHFNEKFNVNLKVIKERLLAGEG